jgi:3-hydroxyacyl-[acyl-carrier-protein] dehydratase
MPASIMLEALGQLAVLFLLEGAPTEPGKMIGSNTIFFTGCEGVRAHRMCKPGDILTLSVKLKRMKMPLATFEGAIRVGQEKAVIAEDITLTFLYVEAAVAPVSAEGAPQPGSAGTAANPPLRVAMNA